MNYIVSPIQLYLAPTVSLQLTNSRQEHITVGKVLCLRPPIVTHCNPSDRSGAVVISASA